VTEGRVYLCTWAQVPGGYRVWLKDDPTVAAEHADFEEADELLYEQIMRATGDGENQHEYVPPAPVASAGAIERGRLWELGRESRVEMSHEPPYFEGGLCDNCLMPLGPRTDLPLEVSTLTGGGNAARVRLRGAVLGTGPGLTIVSERLLEMFTDAERGAFEWRPVQGASRRRAFFELIPLTPTTPYVCPKGLEAPAGRCETCGFTWPACKQGKGLPDSYVSDGDLPRPARTLLAVDHFAYAMLAVTDGRWRELVGQPSLKGVKGSPVAIIAAEAVGQLSEFIPRSRAKRAW
jgi:hypothetical protein